MRLPHLIFAVVLGMLGWCVERSCAAQERVTGRPTIIDGDSFKIGAAEVRLFGVDAPEGRQSCTRDAREWRCGDAAATKLKSLIGGNTITCVKRDVDDYGRIVGECRKGTVDLAAEMARAGLAVAYRRYSKAYVDEEDEARAAKRGLWSGAFTPPEDWRREGHTARAEPTPSGSSRRDGCYIKGNINTEDEKIYHTPDSPAYASTAIDEGKGERWFCTQSEARAAGFRPPGGRARR